MLSYNVPVLSAALFYTPGVNSGVFSACRSRRRAFLFQLAYRQRLTAFGHGMTFRPLLPRNVGPLLGAKPGNRYFTRRIIPPPRCINAGKVKWLLVSGDNGKEYDEPSAMQQALICVLCRKRPFLHYAGLPRWTPWFAPGVRRKPHYDYLASIS